MDKWPRVHEIDDSYRREARLHLYPVFGDVSVGKISPEMGRYAMPATAVEQLLNVATESATSIEVAEWAAGWNGGAPADGAR